MLGWLGPLLGEDGIRVDIAPPRGWEYKYPLVEIRDAGGPGARNAVLDQRRISFEVTAPTRVEAMDLVHRVRDLLLLDAPPPSTSWLHEADTAAPTFVASEDDRAARYVYTVRILVRATR